MLSLTLLAGEKITIGGLEENKLKKLIKKKDKVYSRDIAYNVIPHIDDFTSHGFTKEEMKQIYTEMMKVNISWVN